MQAAGQNGIPTAFIVNQQGKIAWIGHPMGLKEPLLEDILAGRYDLKKAADEFAANAKREAKERELSRKLNTSLRTKNWADAEAALAEMEKGLSEQQREGYAMVHFQISAGRKDYDAAYKTLHAYADANKDEPAVQNQVAWVIVS